MKQIKILWTDDEIDLLKPHILFLLDKGYDVATANNGDDAIELVKKHDFDLIFLDEHMPGKGGLEVLREIKNLYPSIPVVMITKNEAEDIMEAAIGSHISDYLIKPVNPKQILLSIKKNTETKHLITKKTTADYQAEFGKLGIMINDAYCPDDWKKVYKKLTFWELELSQSSDSTMDEVLKMQKADANSAFSKYIKKNYPGLFERNSEDAPLISPNVFRKKVLP
ncbi:MAG: response regulator, partial [Bacteroidetes bacterium]|nr:response regulator [Bacteroidota bacterium]